MIFYIFIKELRSLWSKWLKNVEVIMVVTVNGNN